MPAIHEILKAPVVSALRKAWADSLPGTDAAHEEGGFIVQDPGGQLKVARWSTGASNSILVPLHSGCKIADSDIVATFHTHPNIGSDYLQEPSETDKRAVREDPDLKGSLYQGELVVSQAIVYLISPSGTVS